MPGPKILPFRYAAALPNKSFETSICENVPGLIYIKREPHSVSWDILIVYVYNCI